MIRLTPHGMEGALAEADLQRLQAQYNATHCFRLPGLLSAESVELLQRFLDDTPFAHRVHDGIGTEYCLPDSRAVRLMFFLVNDPKFFAVIQSITGCPRIGCFTGRIYRMVPGADDFDTWHSDFIQTRMVGMSVNLGPAYEGGVFQLRECGAEQLLSEAPNIVPGDAILFRIDRRLEHWITPMTGTTPKTAFAGWFRSEPEFMTLKDRAGEPPLDEPDW